MKKTFYLLLLFYGMTNAQIVNITDTYFKAKLLEASPSNNIAKDANGNSIAIDTNEDNEIQISEALTVYELNISYSNIHNVAGLSAFTNLTSLYCAHNQIVGLNQHLSGLSNLVTLDCSSNDISLLSTVNNLHNLVTLDINNNRLTTLNISGLSNLTTIDCSGQLNTLDMLNLSDLPNLTYLDCSSNSLDELDVSGLTSLITLNCSNNAGITSLEISNLPNLITLLCSSGNSLTTLNVSNLPNLVTLDFYGNNELATLNLSNLPNLEILKCGYNQILETLDFTVFPSLTSIDCRLNNLSSVNVSGLINLTTLNLESSNNLTTLNASGLHNLITLNVSGSPNMNTLNISDTPNLMTLICNHNNLYELDLSGSPNLMSLNCSSNNLTSLDCSNNYYLEFPLDIRYNPITYLSIKNGSNTLQLNGIFGIPENCYICIDPSDIGNYNIDNLPEGTRVSVYCTDYPGATYNTITGSLLFDVNNDGSCDENDSPQPFIKINITNGIDESSAFADDLGSYTFYTQEGTFTLTPQIVDNIDFFNITPENSVVTFPDNNNNTEILNFCITSNGEHADVEVLIVPVEPARPGFPASYKIVYRNKGNQTVSGSINFEFDDELLNLVSSNPDSNTQSAGLLIYNFTDLVPFENREISLTFEVNSPTETPPVNIGDILSFMAEISIPTDENPEDNIYELNQEVVGSYDPNDITCLEGESVSPEMIGEELHYLIRFENTGNYPAERVVIAMGINPDEYDVSSLQLLDTSHEVQARVEDNTAEFFFEQINLGAGEQGNVLLSINSRDTLTIGDSVTSQADIYFDYNYPITTNEAETTFEILGTEDVGSNAAVSIYPNPVKDNVTIKSESRITSIELYDQSGKLLKVSFINQPETNQNLSYLSPGVYFLKIYTGQGAITHKVIKQ